MLWSIEKILPVTEIEARFLGMSSL